MYHMKRFLVVGRQDTTVEFARKTDGESLHLCSQNSDQKSTFDVLQP